jgi:hypothetical protein
VVTARDYLLLGALSDEQEHCVYVGKAKDLRKRLRTHRSRPPIPWWRAIAIVRDTSDGFNTAETGYLEGRVASELASLPRIELRAERLDSDTSLPRHLLLQLDSFVPTILAALRLAGLDLGPAEGQPKSRRTGGPKRSIPGTVGDLLAAGLLSAGTKLTFRRAGRQAEAVVTAEGELLVNGKSYTSPSRAAADALGLKATNGWVSWALDDGRGPKLAELRALLGESPDGRRRAFD